MCACVCVQAEILHSLTYLLDEARGQFPRLYFLSDDELIEMLAASRDVQQLLPTVRKCFPGVADIVFELPSAISSNSSGKISGASLALNGMYCEYCVYL
jgi:dynein heavy chain, axonemal